MILCPHCETSMSRTESKGGVFCSHCNADGTVYKCGTVVVAVCGGEAKRHTMYCTVKATGPNAQVAADILAAAIKRKGVTIR